MCPVPFNSAHSFVALGSWLVESTKYVCRQGLLRMDLLLTAVGVAKRGRIFSHSSFFIVDTMWPQGAADIRWNRITSSLTNFHILVIIISNLLFCYNILSNYKISKFIWTWCFIICASLSSGIVANMLNCNIIVSKFELQSHYYVHFWTNTLGKNKNSLISPAIGHTIPILSFFKDGHQL